MGAFIARQPNGLLCRFSSIVDCPTAWNMTENDYIAMCLERAEEEARDVLKNYIRDFQMVKDNFIPNNMSEKEFEEFLKDCSDEDTSLAIIFLDIDGVLNNSDSWSLPIEQQILDEKLLLLKQIVEETGARIVISSSWRNYSRHMWAIRAAFKRHGLYVYSTTPRLDGDNKRGDEIRKWLKINHGVKSFVILDDDNDMCEYTKTNLIRTNYNIGLTEEQAVKAVTILKGKTDD